MFGFRDFGGNLFGGTAAVETEDNAGPTIWGTRPDPPRRYSTPDAGSGARPRTALEIFRPARCPAAYVRARPVRFFRPDGKGDSRLYVTNGTSREVTQRLGGWQATNVMDPVYSRVGSEEIAPEMRAAASRACACPGAEEFLKEVGLDVSLVGGGGIDLSRELYARGPRH